MRQVSYAVGEEEQAFYLGNTKGLTVRTLNPTPCFTPSALHPALHPKPYALPPTLNPTPCPIPWKSMKVLRGAGLQGYLAHTKNAHHPRTP